MRNFSESGITVGKPWLIKREIMAQVGVINSSTAYVTNSLAGGPLTRFLFCGRIISKI
jgi:hypothetical protein